MKNQRRPEVDVHCGLIPVDSSALYSLLLATLQWDGGENRKSKTEKTPGKAKAAHTSEAKYGIHSLLPTDRQVFSHIQNSRAPSRVMVS